MQSLVEGNTWRVKVDANDTVEIVCKKLSKKIDEKYKFVELYVTSQSTEENGKTRKSH